MQIGGVVLVAASALIVAVAMALRGPRSRRNSRTASRPGDTVADGPRPHDRSRGTGLKVTGVDKEQLTSFQLDVPGGSISFAGYPTLLPDQGVRWEIYPPAALGGSRTPEEILALVVEALTAYGYSEGAYSNRVEVVPIAGVRFP